MPHPLFVDLRRALDGGPEREMLAELAERLMLAPLFAPASAARDASEGKVALTLVGKSEQDRELLVALDADVAEARLKTASGVIKEISGSSVLKMVQQAPFGLIIVDSDDSLTLNYQTLLLFVQLIAIKYNDGAAPNLGTAEVTRQYPTLFARWLYDYCRQQQDISQAWLGLISIPGKSRLDVGVALDHYASSKHDAEIRQQIGLLLPGQFLHLNDSNGGDGFNLLRPLTDELPFYDKSHKQGWWGRLGRKLHPTPVPCIALSITGD